MLVMPNSVDIISGLLGWKDEFSTTGKNALIIIWAPQVIRVSYRNKCQSVHLSVHQQNHVPPTEPWLFGATVSEFCVHILHER